jgi:hypothetical protein
VAVTSKEVPRKLDKVQASIPSQIMAAKNQEAKVSKTYMMFNF